MTQAQIATYSAALKEARLAFDRAIKREAEIAHEAYLLKGEISRLRRTITALSAMCSESPGMDDLGITDSCMEVMQAEKGTVTTADVVKALEAMGFDLASQKNASASVHAVLSRLARNGKIQKVTDAETNMSWRGPNFDAKFDEDIPF